MTRRIPVNRAQHRLARPPRERFATRALAFDVAGDTCRGTLYLPGGDADDLPVVVMAPGLGAERS
ncbi:peptidase S15, partial [Halorubrum sp. AD140]|nr:peptidase S15 [Halorubrum sp. AD140]